MKAANADQAEVISRSSVPSASTSPRVTASKPNVSPGVRHVNVSEQRFILPGIQIRPAAADGRAGVLPCTDNQIRVTITIDVAGHRRDVRTLRQPFLP